MARFQSLKLIWAGPGGDVGIVLIRTTSRTRTLVVHVCATAHLPNVARIIGWSLWPRSDERGGGQHRKMSYSSDILGYPHPGISWDYPELLSCTVRYGTLPYGTVRYCSGSRHKQSLSLYGRYGTVRYRTVPYGTPLQYIYTVQYTISSYRSRET